MNKRNKTNLFRPLLLSSFIAATFAVGPVNTSLAKTSNLSHFESNFTKIIIYPEINSDSELPDVKLYVLEFELALDVVERDPVEVVTSYTLTDARAWCWLKIDPIQ